MDGDGRVIQPTRSTGSPMRFWLPGLGIVSLALRNSDASIRYADKKLRRRAGSTVFS